MSRMRIIGGAFRGRNLNSPKDNAIRPTSDRVREAIFNILESSYAENLIDGYALDLCCGTGALGLEALSRGAANCTFIDRNKASITLTQKNIAACKMKLQSRTLQQNLTGGLQGKNDITLVLMDPPYDDEGIAKGALSALHRNGWLADACILCIEQPKQRDLTFNAPYTLEKEKKYSRSKLYMLRYNIVIQNDFYPFLND